MLNENTGEEIRCPYCRAAGECPHLLAVLDMTFNSCTAGYACRRFPDFERMARNTFMELLPNGATEEHSWIDGELAELWKYAQEAYSPSDQDAFLDSGIITRLIVNLFNGAGGEEYTNLIDGEGGPGCSSAITLFYAEHPVEVFNAAITAFDALLTRQRLQRSSLSGNVAAIEGDR